MRRSDRSPSDERRSLAHRQAPGAVHEQTLQQIECAFALHREQGRRWATPGYCTGTVHKSLTLSQLLVKRHVYARVRDSAAGRAAQHARTLEIMAIQGCSPPTANTSGPRPRSPPHPADSLALDVGRVRVTLCAIVRGSSRLASPRSARRGPRTAAVQTIAPFRPAAWARLASTTSALQCPGNQLQYWESEKAA
jgi:hypothetical protein